jgi:hypothetical protein
LLGNTIERIPSIARALLIAESTYVVQAVALVKPGHERPEAVPTTQGLSQLHVPLVSAHGPVWRKSGFGAMLAAGFEIVSAGGVTVGALITVVVVTGAMVVVATDDSCEFDCADRVVVALPRRTAACRTRADAGASCLIVVRTEVTARVIVEGEVWRGVEDEALAIAGSPVVLRTVPNARAPNDPRTTERRGRRDVLRRASTKFWCPCVTSVMYQLSESQSKLASTVSQLPLKSDVVELFSWLCSLQAVGHNR